VPAKDRVWTGKKDLQTFGAGRESQKSPKRPGMVVGQKANGQSQLKPQKNIKTKAERQKKATQIWKMAAFIGKWLLIGVVVIVCSLIYWVLRWPDSLRKRGSQREWFLVLCIAVVFIFFKELFTYFLSRDSIETDLDARMCQSVSARFRPFALQDVFLYGNVFKVDYRDHLGRIHRATCVVSSIGRLVRWSHDKIIG
jgi:hypothetical protein